MSHVYNERAVEGQILHLKKKIAQCRKKNCSFMIMYLPSFYAYVTDVAKYVDNFK